MEQLKIMIEPRFPVLILMFPNGNVAEKALILSKIIKTDTYNYSKVFEGLASLCFRKRKPCQNPVPALESTFYLGKFHCQAPQKPCSLFYITKRNINLNPKLNYNGKYSF